MVLRDPTAGIHVTLESFSD